MKLEQIVGKELCGSIKEARTDTDEYEEIVFFTEDIPAWDKILTEKLGSPLVSKEEFEILESSEDVLSSEIAIALEHANSFGGITKGQTLYYGIYDSNIILILIWPWQDNKTVTLKKAII